MNKESSMAKERVYTLRRERERDLDVHDISVQWDRGEPEATQAVGEDAYGSVTLALVPRNEEIAVASARLSRQQVNQLVRVLRRARNVAFEVDE